MILLGCTKQTARKLLNIKFSEIMYQNIFFYVGNRAIALLRTCAVSIPNKNLSLLAVLRRSVQRGGGAHLRVIALMDNTVPFEKMLQRWRVVDNTVSNLNGVRFEPLTSRSRDEHVTTRPTGRCNQYLQKRIVILDLSITCQIIFHRFNFKSVGCCIKHVS